MQDIQTVDYREFIGDTKEAAVPQRRGFPVYRTLFGIQLICALIVAAAAKGWL